MSSQKKTLNIKYLSIYVGNEDCDDGVQAFDEKGNLIMKSEDIPLDYGNFNLKIDVDEGKIVDWPEKKISVKVYMRAMDTGFYDFYDKNNNLIYKEEGYVPDFLGINSPAYGDDINFDTDCNGFILKWKEKNIKEQIIEFLQKRLNNE